MCHEAIIVSEIEIGYNLLSTNCAYKALDFSWTIFYIRELCYHQILIIHHFVPLWFVERTAVNPTRSRADNSRFICHSHWHLERVKHIVWAWAQERSGSTIVVKFDNLIKPNGNVSFQLKLYSTQRGFGCSFPGKSWSDTQNRCCKFKQVGCRGYRWWMLFMLFVVCVVRRMETYLDYRCKTHLFSIIRLCSSRKQSNTISLALKIYWIHQNQLSGLILI